MVKPVLVVMQELLYAQWLAALSDLQVKVLAWWRDFQTLLFIYLFIYLLEISCLLIRWE